MKTLIIYDNKGKIWHQITGTYEVPEGLPYLEEEIPEGKYPVSVDATGEAPYVIYANFPKSDTAELKEQVNNLTIALAQIMGV